MKNKVLNFLSQAVSKDERYVSILIIFAIIFTIVAIYILITNDDIPTNLLTLIIWLYGFIAANSSIDGITEKINMLNRKE